MRPHPESELNAIASGLEQTDDPVEQQELVRDYTTAVAPRPPEEQAAWMARLSELLAP